MATLPRFELREDEVVEVELVEFDDYAKHANQLAAVTNQRLLFIKRKEFSKYPYALEDFPIHDWHGLKYRSTYALFSMIAGITMVIFGILIFVFRFSGELQSGPSYPLALVMLSAGAAMTFGVKRHVLALKVKDRTIRWKCAPLQFQGKLPRVRQLIDMAKERGIPVDGAPDSPSDSDSPLYPYG